MGYPAWRFWAQPDDSARAAEQIARGRELYADRCASCHEVQDGIGPPLDAKLLAAYGSPRALFDYVQMAMPSDAPGSLTLTEYWQVVAYALESRGLLPPAVVLDTETADQVRLREQIPR